MPLPKWLRKWILEWQLEEAELNIESNVEERKSLYNALSESLISESRLCMERARIISKLGDLQDYMGMVRRG